MTAQARLYFVWLGIGVGSCGPSGPQASVRQVT